MHVHLPLLAIILSLFTWHQPLNGQALDCEGERYVNDVFTEIDSSKAVPYGRAIGSSGNASDLLMDVYLPANDTTDSRPMVVLAFGGGFTDGSRQDMAEFCRRFARKGYVAATIDYRLVDGLQFLTIRDSSDAINFLIRAFQDVKASIRFLKHQASGENEFGIDPDRIFVGGVSAGAIAAAHAVYLDSTDEVSAVYRQGMQANGGWAGDSNDLLDVDSEVRGVISWSGALNNANWIDPSDPPLLTVHDDGDVVVPYGSMRITVGLNVSVTFQGSEIMDARAREIGLYTEDILVRNSGEHVSYFLNPTTVDVDSVVNSTATFMKRILCGETTAVSSTSSIPTQTFSFYPNPAHKNLVLGFPQSGIPMQIEILELSGKRVHTQSIISGEAVPLTLPSLSEGIYMLIPRNLQNSYFMSPQLIELR